MNLAFADRDFYYGDPDFAPEEPVKGLLSKEYALARAKLINWDKNDPEARPGDPYPFQGGANPFLKHLEAWTNLPKGPRQNNQTSSARSRRLHGGTTSIQATTKKGGWCR